MAQMNIILPDGSKLEVQENASAYDVAKQISEGLARNALACKINGELSSLTTTLKNDDKLEINKPTTSIILVKKLNFFPNFFISTFLYIFSCILCPCPLK